MQPMFIEDYKREILKIGPITKVWKRHSNQVVLKLYKVLIEPFVDKYFINSLESHNLEK